MFVIFDYDGVVYDSLPVVHHASNRLYDRLGLPRESLDQARRWLGPPIRDGILRTLALNGMSTADVETLEAEYLDYLTDASLDLGRAFPGMVELLGDIRAAGIPLGIATMKAQTEIDALSGALPGLSLAEVVEAPVDHRGGTSKTELVANAVARLAAGSGTDGWMVGDRPSDIEAGSASGLESIAVLWGAGTKAELSRAKPSAYAATPQDLRSILMPACEAIEVTGS